MSSERPSKGDSTRDKITRSFGKLSRLWRPAVSSPMNMNSVPDNYIAKTDAGYVFQSCMCNVTKLLVIGRTHRSANTTQEYRSALQTSLETFTTPRAPTPFPSLSVGGTR